MSLFVGTLFAAHILVALGSLGSPANSVKDNSLKLNCAVYLRCQYSRPPVGSLRLIRCGLGLTLSSCLSVSHYSYAYLVLVGALTLRKWLHFTFTVLSQCPLLRFGFSDPFLFRSVGPFSSRVGRCSNAPRPNCVLCSGFFVQCRPFLCI